MDKRSILCPKFTLLCCHVLPFPSLIILMVSEDVKHHVLVCGVQKRWQLCYTLQTNSSARAMIFFFLFNSYPESVAFTRDDGSDWSVTHGKRTQVQGLWFFLIFFFNSYHESVAFTREDYSAWSVTRSKPTRVQGLWFFWFFFFF